jgi:DNA polymerase-1
MLMQNVAFPGLPKGLDFLSSMYRRRHVYWKDEGKLWDSKMPEERLWGYNCEDAVATFEIHLVLEHVLRELNLWELYEFQMEVWEVAFEMMLRGVRIDQLSRGKIAAQMLEAIQDREQALNYILGRPFNVRSPKQCHFLFYSELNCRIIKDRKTKKPTANDDAMQIWAREEPLLRPIIRRISDVRSLGVVLSNTVQSRLDPDGRMRSSFSPTAETFRWTSSESAFDTGGNMQNWTKGDEDAEESSLQAGQARIPNVRKLIVPDLNYEIASIDLTGADAQTVAWEANDEELKRVFRENKIKIHAHNAMRVFGDKAPTGYEQPYYDYIRTGVHLVNYCGKARTLAGALNTSEWEAQRFIDYWFSLHPGILDWHLRLEDQLNRTRCIYNRFGYRRFYFDRVQDLLPEATAWIGQSTTACVTNRALVALRKHDQLRKLGLELLFQVHDEIVFQYPAHRADEILALVKPIAHIPVPYDDPLVIPWGLKTSRISWGDCEKRSWPV